MKSSLPFLFSAMVVCSCGTTKPEKPKEEPKKQVVEAPKLVGRIASIPADKRFVLIQSYGKWSMESGAILTTRGPDDRTANLRITGEKLGEFAAADLQSGFVEVGDAVYSQHVAKPASLLTSPEVPHSQDSPTTTTIQKNN